MALSLNDGDRARLAEMGVTADAQGFLTSAGGRPVDPGVAVPMLQKDLSGAGEGVAKGMVPARFHRPYLAAGHQADSPAVTGHQTVIPAPHMDGTPGGHAAVAEPQDYQRGFLRPGHQAEPPDNNPDGNNPHAPGSPASEVLATGAGRFGQNGARSGTERLTPTGFGVTGPAPARMALPQDMRASEVPHSVSVSATRAAPGESAR